MGLMMRWVVHTACHVLGYQNDNKIECKSVVGYQNDRHQIHGNGIIKSSSKEIRIGNGSSENLEAYASGFQMPLHYPRYSKADYEKMEEWKIDMLLREYGLSFLGTVEEKRAYTMGAFLWPDQC